MKQPFSQARWEHDSQHFFYLPTQFQRLQEPKPTYLVGTRGTGKTTLLKALNWEERLHNTSLQRQLSALNQSEDYFAAHYVGVYFKLPRIQMELFDAMLGADHPLYTNLTALYLAFNWVDLLAEATVGLLDKGILNFSSAQEVKAARAAFRHFEDSQLVRRYISPDEVQTLRELAVGTRRLRHHLEREIQTGAKEEQLAENFPIGRLTEFADVVAKALIELYPKDEEEPWYFLICMDEGESLTESQQKTINSLVRIAERPVLPVVAYLSLPNPLTETADQLTTTNADLDVISIDAMADSEFTQFVEGVASVRLQEATGDSDVSVDLTSMLGPLDINRLLEVILKTSSDGWAKDLLKDAEAVGDDSFFEEKKSKAPPIYQMYLVKTLGIDVPRERTPSWELRKQKSAEIRKKMAAAYLSICRRLNSRPLYASSQMLLQMSDLCVRDFLWQMHEIFVEVDLPADEFAKAADIPIEAQNRALRRASENKINRVGDFVLAETTTVSRLVDGLGQLTTSLQRPTEAQLKQGFTRHLRSNEPGAFRLPPSKEPKEYEDTMDLIKEAIDASYLRLVPSQSESFRFRVHTSLAAHYEFSYRGAYSDMVLTLDEITELCRTTDDAKRAELVKEISDRLMKQDDPHGTLSLLEGSEP